MVSSVIEFSSQISHLIPFAPTATRRSLGTQSRWTIFWLGWYRFWVCRRSRLWRAREAQTVCRCTRPTKGFPIIKRGYRCCRVIWPRHMLPCMKWVWFTRLSKLWLKSFKDSHGRTSAHEQLVLSSNLWALFDIPLTGPRLVFNPSSVTSWLECTSTLHTFQIYWTGYSVSVGGLELHSLLHGSNPQLPHSIVNFPGDLWT